jgi:hypothetical protein
VATDDPAAINLVRHASRTSCARGMPLDPMFLATRYRLRTVTSMSGTSTERLREHLGELGDCRSTHFVVRPPACSVPAAVDATR